MPVNPPAPFLKRSDALRMRPESDPRIAPDQPVESLARQMVADAFKLKLQPAKASYLYTILPLVSGTVNGTDQNFVLYEPEFLFVYDFGFSAHVGLTVFWKTDALGKGDPEFPNLKDPIIRSVSSLVRNRLVFPDSPGEIIFALTAGTSLDSVEDKLAAYGLSDFEELFPGTYVCKCTHFEELATCQRMTAELSFIRYAETNTINRLVDFSPGWTLKRLM